MTATGVPVRRPAEDEGRPRVRPAHGGGTEHRWPARRCDAARRAVPRQRGGEDSPGLLQEDLFEAVIGLAPNLFYGTGIPASILVLNRAKPGGAQGQGAVHRRVWESSRRGATRTVCATRTSSVSPGRSAPTPMWRNMRASCRSPKSSRTTGTSISVATWIPQKRRSGSTWPRRCGSSGNWSRSGPRPRRR